jgi:hypothetical protein
VRVKHETLDLHKLQPTVLILASLLPRLQIAYLQEAACYDHFLTLQERLRRFLVGSCPLIVVLERYQSRELESRTLWTSHVRTFVVS